MTTRVIVNPHSGKGRGARVLPALRSAFDGPGTEIVLTRVPGDEERLAREAVAAGCDTIVAVGGDGTWSNVGHAILECAEGAASRVALGLVPGGTGCDLARTLGIPQNDPVACASIVASKKARAIDVGRLDGRHFLNVAGFGFDIAVLERSRRVKWLRGELLYLYCALLELKAYRGFRLSSSLDDGAAGPGGPRMMMVIVANAKVFGGGLPIAPEARIDDGELDIVAFGDLSFPARLRAMAALLRKRHNDLAAVSTTRARWMTFEFDAPPSYETDGEWRRASSARLVIETRPAALRVLAP